ncbi:MAG TPA: HepT-like ribonuclease domain-containing protein [Gemmatimonadota bacterium]|nr:HepT-like ribonuclease domain-containing protein [Gemmatimonadota bacterium]
MAEPDFSEILRDLDALDSEIEAIRVAVDEGEEMFTSSPTARQAALRHLEAAVRHTVESARGLIEEADWEEPENSLDAIEILVEEDVLPGRVGVTLIGLAEYTAELGEESVWEADADATGAFERLSEGVDALAEYQEYMSHFLKEWGD